MDKRIATFRKIKTEIKMDGKTWNLSTRTRLKSDAKIEAKNLRKHGKHARILDLSKGKYGQKIYKWAVYYRNK